MTTEQEYNFQGWVTEIDNARNYRPFRVGMKDATNQYQWFGTFDAKTGQMLEQAGINSGPWNIQYIMKPWTGQDGIERYNYNISLCLVNRHRRLHHHQPQHHSLNRYRNQHLNQQSQILKLNIRFRGQHHH